MLSFVQRHTRAYSTTRAYRHRAYGPTSIWGGRPSFARMDSVGGGGVVAEVTYPKFVFFFR